MPRHKKKRRAANAAASSVKKIDWLVGDLVVVKLRGHRPWPAQVQKPEDYGYDARPHRIFVTFFGTEETCFCSYNKITPFTSAMRKSLAEQLQKINTNSELERAIKEIFAADDELKKSRDSNRHKDDEIGSEKSEGGEAPPPVERSRKRGRAVEEESPTDIAEERSAKHGKTVKKMAPEQVHKLLPKVRIKVSSQPSDSSNNQQASSGAPTSEKASVSSAEAPSQEISPHRTSDSNEKIEEADAPGKKKVRATRLHDAAELADAQDKENVRAASDQRSEHSVKSPNDDANHGVQNGDDAEEQTGMDEDSEGKRSSVGLEDVDKMDVDDENVKDAKVVEEVLRDGRERDSIDHHGVEGLDEEDAKKEKLDAAEQQQFNYADTLLPSVVKAEDSKSEKSMDSGDWDVLEDTAGDKIDLEQDHQTAAESVPKDEVEGSEVTAKPVQAITTPEMEDAEVRKGGGKNEEGSVSTKQEDDFNEAQTVESPLEEPPTVDASTATDKYLSLYNCEPENKDSASGDASSTLTKEDQGATVAVTVGSDHQTTTLGKQEGAKPNLGDEHASGDSPAKTPIVDGNTETTDAETDNSVMSQSTTVGEVESGDTLKTESQALTQEPGGVGDGEETAKSANTAQAVIDESAKVQPMDEDSEKSQTTVKDSATTEPVAEAGVVKDASDADASEKEATTESEGVPVLSEKGPITESEQPPIHLMEASAEKEEIEVSYLKGDTEEKKLSTSPMKDAAPRKEEALVPSAGTDDVEATMPPEKDAFSAGEKVAPATKVQEAIKANEKE